MQIVTARSIRCDSCGAPFNAVSPKCLYCGQTPVILVKGVRLTELLEMYLYASQWQELRETASECLREYPLNSVAWAAKGIVSVVLENDGNASLKCFELAQRSAPIDSIVHKFRREAAEICFKRAQSAWLECQNNNRLFYGGQWSEWLTAWLQGQIKTVIFWAEQALNLDANKAPQCKILLDNSRKAWMAHVCS